MASTVSSSWPPTHPNNDARVHKRRRQTQKVIPARQQSITSNPKLAAYAFSEEKLFELLIGKIRQREENELAAADIRQRLETQKAELTEENQNLRGQLTTYNEQLQKAVADSKTRQSLMNSWKTKLQKFKQVVNELGNEYEFLRDEANKMKVTTTSLEKEKGELAEELDKIKIQISRAEATIDEQRDKTTADDGVIKGMRQSLETLKEQLKDAKTDLTEEKRRNATLELYIQTYARGQTRQLASIKEGQSQLLEKLTSASAVISEESAASRDTFLSEMRTFADDLQSSIQTLGEDFSAERLNIQGFSNTAHDIVTR